MNINDIQKVAISQDTQRFLGCMLKLRDVYGDVLDALTAMYGERGASEMITEEFLDPYEALESVIDSFFIGSIKYNIGCTDKNEI